MADLATTDTDKDSVRFETPKALPIKWNFAAVLVGRLIYSGCQWAIVVVIAQLGSPQILGDYTLAIAIAGPVFMFANLNLRYVIATDADWRFSLQDYAFVRFWTSAAAMVGMVLFAVTSNYGFVWLLLAIIASKTVEAITDFIAAVLQKHERMDRIAILQTSKGCVSLVAIAIPFYLTRRIEIAAACLAISWLLHLIFVEWRLLTWVTGSTRLSWRSLFARNANAWNVVAFAFPLGLSTLLISLNTFVPRYFIGHHLGSGALGVFAAIASLTLMAEMIFRAASNAAVARLSIYVAAKNKLQFWKLMGCLFGIAAAAGLIGTAIAWFAGEPLLGIAFGQEYAEHSSLFVWLSGAMMISYLASIGPALVALKRTREFFVAWLITVVCLVAALSVLVPKFELAGVAYAIIIANMVRLTAMISILIHATAKEFSVSESRQ